MKIRRPCYQPGCPNLIEGGRYCSDHQHKIKDKWRASDAGRLKDPQTGAAKRFRSSAEWQRIRRIKLISNPICEDPHGIHAASGTTATATEIHHIIRIVHSWEDRNNLDNLMALCEKCHDIYTKAERT